MLKYAQRNLLPLDLFSNGIHGFYTSPTGKGFPGRTLIITGFINNRSVFKYRVISLCRSRAGHMVINGCDVCAKVSTFVFQNMKIHNCPKSHVRNLSI